MTSDEEGAMNRVLLLLTVVSIAALAACSASGDGKEGDERMWIGVVRYQDPKTLTYISSPSILRIPGGVLLATHDYFGPGAPLDHEGREFLTSVYRSTDEGSTWTLVNHLSSIFWASLFEHRGAVYLLGPSAHNGAIVIRRSDDAGYTWTTPTNDTTGLLFPDGAGREMPNYHCAPVPVVKHGGRIWRAFENNDVRTDFARGFGAVVISADENADLLHASSWRMSERLGYDQAWNPPGFGEFSGWLEGNAVVGPDGEVWDVLRLNSYPALNKGALVRVLDEGRALGFDPATGFIDLPGGASKFTIRRDSSTGVYWMLSNDMQDQPFPIRRNRLSLFSSGDLRNWTRRTVLLDYTLATPEEAVQTTGFQYVDWQFDGEDIIYLVRTAYDGAHNFHDSNMITFGKIRDFRRLAVN